MNKTSIKHKIFAFVLSASSLVCAAFVASDTYAQDNGASTTFRKTERDPFAKPRPAPSRRGSGSAAASKPAGPKQVEAPPIQTRIDNYKRLRIEAMTQQKPAPKPTTALTLNEVEVTGIFRTPRGYAAMIEAKPINLSYVIYPGEMFYDGQLVAIEESRLLFRREVRWTNNKRELVPEYKPLRAPQDADDLSLTKTSKGDETKDEKSKDADKEPASPKPDEGKRNEANRKAMNGVKKP